MPKSRVGCECDALAMLPAGAREMQREQARLVVIDPQPVEFWPGWVSWPWPIEGECEPRAISWHVATHRRLHEYFSPIDQFSPLAGGVACELGQLSDEQCMALGFDGRAALASWAAQEYGTGWASVWVWARF